MPEMHIELQRSLASSLGVSAADAAQALRIAFAGNEVGDWVDPNGETRDVTLRLHPQDRANLTLSRACHCCPAAAKAGYPWNKSPASQWTKPPPASCTPKANAP